MFIKPENWNELTPKERLEKRLEHMVSSDGIEFVDSDAKAAYEERITLIRDAVELKKTPARVPVNPRVNEFALRYAGLTPYDMMYDHQKAMDAFHSFDLEFQPDFGSGGGGLSGRILDILDCRLVKWPGHGLPKETGYQFIEGEYMSADEYPHLLADPTDFLMHRFIPRIYGALEPLKTLPVLTRDPLGLMPMNFMPFAMPDVQGALGKMIEAGKESLKISHIMRSSMIKSRASGFPSMAGGGSFAPFDVIGDVLRGTRGIMLDLYRRPELVIETCEKFQTIILNGVLAMADMADSPFRMMPLHKGDDSHMSNDQFEKFYWPTLKKLMLGMCEEGLMPMPFAEGSYNNKLEIIADFPKGQCIWYFDRTDMHRAKEILGDTACIMGNVPTSLMHTGTPDDVEAYCRNLIDVAGKEGGFVLSTGAGMQGAKAENVKAMMDFSKDYGIYR